MISRKETTQTNLNRVDNIEIVVKPFPLLTDKLKGLKDKYYDAVWDHDLDRAFQLKQEIDSVLKSIELGEKYDIPF